MFRVRAYVAGAVSVFALLLSVLAAVPAQANETGSISGTVTDSTGSPLAGIRVIAAMPWNRYPDNGESHIAMEETTTDANGEYTIDGLSDGVSYRITFVSMDGQFASELWDTAHDRYAAKHVKVVAGKSIGGIDAAMSDGNSVSGTISTSDGDEIGGQTIDLWVYRYSEERQRFDSSTHLALRTSVNPDGSFEIARLPEGRYKVGFNTTGKYLSRYFGDTDDAESAKEILVREGQPLTGIDVKLLKSATVSGTVSTPVDGPIYELDYQGSFDVVAFRQDPDTSEFELAGVARPETGDFTISDLSPGTYRFEFRAPYPGFYRAVFSGGASSLEDAEDVVITEGQQLRLPAVLMDSLSGDWRNFCDTTLMRISTTPPRVGETISTSGGMWVPFSDAKERRLECNLENASYTYRWSIVGQDQYETERVFAETTAPSVTVPPEALGKHIRVNVIGENPDYDFGTFTSDTTTDVTAPALTPRADSPKVAKQTSTLGVKTKAKKKRKVEFAVAVKSNKKAASGQVAVYRGTQKVKTVKLKKSGKATVKLSKQPKGSQTYTIRYLGSAKTKPAAKNVRVRTKK